MSERANHHLRWLAVISNEKNRLLGAQVQAAGNPGVPARLCRVYGPKLQGPVGAKGITKGSNLTLMIQLHRPVQPPPSPPSNFISRFCPYTRNHLPYSPAGLHHHCNATGKLHLIYLQRLTTRHHTPCTTKRHDSAQQCLVLLDFLGWMTGLRPLRRTPWVRQTGLARSPNVPAMLSPPPNVVPVASSAISPCGNYFPRPSHICLRAYLLRLFSFSPLAQNRHRVAVVPLFHPTHTHSRVKIQSSSHPHSLQLSAFNYSELVELISLKLHSFTLLGSV